jgi:argininosuccinate synthase
MAVNIKEVIKKIENAQTPKVNKVALAFSGGLDSSLCVELLRRKYKANEILAFNVDVGQGDEEMTWAKEQSEKLRVALEIIQAKEEFTEECLTKAIRANSDYEGYPVSTSMTRQLIAKHVALRAVKSGCDALMEGSSGKGNDQFRMHNVFTYFAPGLEILVPVRDFDLTRLEERELCNEWGVPVKEALTGGDDKTMWCRSIASGAIALNQELPDNIWQWYVPPEKSSDKPTFIELEFKQGVPVAIDGQEKPLAEIIPLLNEIGGKNSIGKIDMFEDGMMSLKSREIYEAPAAKIILTLHRDLEGFCLTKEQIHSKKDIERQWAYMVYHGQWFHPLMNDLNAYIESSQKWVSGKYKIKLYKGTIDIVERHSDTSLFSPELRSIASAGFDQRESRGATHITGLQYKVLRQRESKAGS